MESDKKHIKNNMRRKEFFGLDSVKLSTGKIDLLVSKSVGPRILSLRYKGKINLFAELPNDYLEYPGDGNFYFYGGHRLWVAPEDPSVTYIPDNQPIRIRESSGFVELIQEINQTTGIQKTIRIRFTDYDDVVVIDHLIHNKGDLPFRCAIWAITQFKLGGVAILPQQTKRIDGNTLLPDRSIVLWPYTDINDPRIRWGNQFIFVDPEPVDQALKIGMLNTQKWMAYFYHNLLFIKYAENYKSEQLVDQGATSECYCNSKFIELETLGSLKQLEPGKTIQHREVWRIVDTPFANLTQETMMDFMENDEMTNVCRGML